ncbi:hypothetical protein Tco_0999475 [Tanacetum coccineum]
MLQKMRYYRRCLYLKQILKVLEVMKETSFMEVEKGFFHYGVPHLRIKGKEHGKLLVDSVFNGPFQYGTVVVPGNETTPATIRERTYIDLTNEEKLRESVDIMATNIVLQARDMYSTNFDNLYAYMRQHEAHANEVRLMRQRYPDPMALVANSYELSPPCLNPTQYYP